MADSGIVAPVASGLIIENFGWRNIFMVSGLFGLASLLPTSLIRDKTVGFGDYVKNRKMTSVFIRDHIRLMALFFSFHMVETWGLGMVDLVLPLFLRDRFQLSYSLIGLFFTGSNIITLLTQIPSGYLADRYGRKRMIVACIGAIPFTFALWPLIDNWPSLLILYIMATGLWSMTWPATLALLTDLVPSEAIGTAFGIRMTGVRLGFTVGPMLAGIMYGSHGRSAPFIMAALIYFAGIPLAMLLTEKQHPTKRDTYGA